ncbi:MAG TPA: glycerate kinase [Bryobacteraceae bacterium]|nr:glycerate kinase [Bryobacteraceae bacterium]
MNARNHALEIFRAALKAADPESAVQRHLSFDGRVLRAGGHRCSLSNFDRIQAIGAGKAGAAMARAVEKVLGGRLAGGIVNVPGGTAARLRKVELNPSGHPIPDRRGVDGARRMLELARAAGLRDLLICVISGGASALLPAPAPPLTLAQKQEITHRLLHSGAAIREINSVRKHLSLIKGGQLARVAWPATVLTLIFSDVVGDDPAVIGSGPTVADSSTAAEATEILRRYKIAVPRGALQKTPKPGDPELARSHPLIVGSNRQAIAAAAAQARKLGYRTAVLSATIQGETREIARMHASIAREILTSGQPLRPPACLLSGGETTVTVKGKGLGGRNQEFVLAAAIELDGAGPFTILSAGTDGIDGPTDAAGAIADSGTLTRAAKLGLDAREYLDRNDSYRFFEPLKALLKTGVTGTNVMDLRVILIGRLDGEGA